MSKNFDSHFCSIISEMKSESRKSYASLESRSSTISKSENLSQDDLAEIILSAINPFPTGEHEHTLIFKDLLLLGRVFEVSLDIAIKEM